MGGSSKEMKNVNFNDCSRLLTDAGRVFNTNTAHIIILESRTFL